LTGVREETEVAENLTIKTENIKEDDSSYCWVNIELGGTRVGKARIKRIYSRVTIKNITIFPEFQGRGFARKIVDLFKDTAREIIADRARSSAKGFWERMGFSDTGDGNYRWVSNRR
jgi:GNAT superfamily N-acetyltransferase